MTQDVRVISVPLAHELRAAGLTWQPARGDRFVVADRGMDDEVFVLSDMTIEVHQFPTGPVIGFNGTTEWALDSLQQQDALWLPAEHQLRDLLGVSFVRLERIGERHRVVFALDGTVQSAEADDPADAYGDALLRAIRRFGGASPPSHSAE
ncbi:MAG: pilus assembly protein CpaE [Actinomycetes bacterium]